MSVNKLRLLTLCYFVIAVAMRFMPHGVNFTAIGALAMFAGCYLTVTQGMLLGLGAMALTDSVGHLLDIESMGYYHRPTMLAVYACFALPSLLGWALRGRVSIGSVPAAAIASSILFFLVTNFAAWLDPNMRFETSLAGLIKAYVDAIPFAGNHFLGSILFSGLFFGVHGWLVRQAPAGRTSIN
jgi:hypothetical protein